jgi:hypothetical protein
MNDLYDDAELLMVYCKSFSLTKAKISSLIHSSNLDLLPVAERP